MSARAGIPKALADAAATLINGTGLYVNNIYGQSGNEVKHFDDINNLPYVSFTPGPEVREDQPSNVSIASLTVYIRIYVEDNNDVQAKLESLISDVETLVDTNLRLAYDSVTPSGVVTRNTITNNIVDIRTDEGLLQPQGLGELQLVVQYEKIRNT